MSYVLLVLAMLLALLGRAAIRSPRGHRPLWVTAMAGSELAGGFAIATLVLLAGFSAAGWAGGRVGTAAQVLLAVAAAAFILALVRGFRAARPARAALADFGSTTPVLRWSRWGSVLAPISRVPPGITTDAAMSYGPHPRHLIDRIGPPLSGVAGPAVVYVHGGGWWRGRRTTQARPMIHLLAAAGWQVFTPSYRLSPEATVPDHLIDVKRAIAWIRDNAGSLGVDPGFIAIAGGSTGGNLAALAALTADDRSLQPGFEDADVSVQSCVPLYGVHDLLDDAGRPLWPYLVGSVMKSEPADQPEAWRRSSPVRMATTGRPPFFVVHGAADTLVGAQLSRRLVAALCEARGPEVGHLEVPWANHGFDFFAGPRGRIVAVAIRGALDHVHSRYRERVGGGA